MNMMDYERLANQLARTTNKTLYEAGSIINSLRGLGVSYQEMENEIEIGWDDSLLQYYQMKGDANKKDMINIDDKIYPKHYNNYPLETIKNMENSMTHDEFMGYLKGNIMKYIARYKYKNGLEDLKKAEYHIKKMIEVVGDEVDEDE